MQKTALWQTEEAADFDSMTDNREIRVLYEAVYYGEVEQAKEYLKQRVNNGEEWWWSAERRRK